MFSFWGLTALKLDMDSMPKSRQEIWKAAIAAVRARRLFSDFFRHIIFTAIFLAILSMNMLTRVTR